MKKVLQSTVSKSQVAARIAGYTAAAGAVLAGAGKAEAGIVYSGPMNLAIGAGQDGSITMQGANPEFQHQHEMGTLGLFFFFYLSNNAQLIPQGATGTQWARMDLNDPIGPTQAWRGQPYYPVMGTGTAYPRDWMDNFGTGYVGIRFALEAPLGGTAYGWLHLENVDNSSWNLLGWAYEDSGAAILAGDIGPLDEGEVIPEPSTLATLALGAAGVLAMRRRKKA